MIRVVLGIVLCPFFGLGIGVIASVLQGVGVDIIGVDLISKKPTMDEIFFVISSYGYITAMWIAAVAGL